MVFLNVYGYKLCVPIFTSIWLLHYITDTGSRAGRYQRLLNELLLFPPVCDHPHLCNPCSCAEPCYFGSSSVGQQGVLWIYTDTEKVDKLGA